MIRIKTLKRLRKRLDRHATAQEVIERQNGTSHFLVPRRNGFKLNVSLGMKGMYSRVSRYPPYFLCSKESAFEFTLYLREALDTESCVTGEEIQYTHPRRSIASSSSLLSIVPDLSLSKWLKTTCQCVMYFRSLANYETLSFEH